MLKKRKGAVFVSSKGVLVMQADAILRIPRCNAMQIKACEDPLSSAKVMNWEENGIVATDKNICELAVPGACPRVRCKKEDGEYAACRMLAFIESQENESGFWMRLPCSSCPEKKDLHPTTEGFVYG